MNVSFILNYFYIDLIFINIQLSLLYHVPIDLQGVCSVDKNRSSKQHLPLDDLSLLYSFTAFIIGCDQITQGSCSTNQGSIRCVYFICTFRNLIVAVSINRFQ